MSQPDLKFQRLCRYIYESAVLLQAARRRDRNYNCTLVIKIERVLTDRTMLDGACYVFYHTKHNMHNIPVGNVRRDKHHRFHVL